MPEKKFEYAFFNPFSGDEYNEGINSKKLFVLGASFYCDDKWRDCHRCCTCTDNKDSSKYELTCPKYKGNKDENGKPLRLSNEPSNVDDYYPVYREFQKLITAATGIEDMWVHITFTNYVQFFLPSFETKEEYFTERDYLAFVEVVQYYEPDVVIVWGRVVREELQRRLSDSNLVTEKTNDRVWKIQLNKEGKERALVFVHHPICAIKNKEIWDADFDEMTDNIKLALR